MTLLFICVCVSVCVLYKYADARIKSPFIWNTFLVCSSELWMGNCEWMNGTIDRNDTVGWWWCGGGGYAMVVQFYLLLSQNPSMHLYKCGEWVCNWDRSGIKVNKQKHMHVHWKCERSILVDRMDMDSNCIECKCTYAYANANAMHIFTTKYFAMDVGCVFWPWIHKSLSMCETVKMPKCRWRAWRKKFNGWQHVIKLMFLLAYIIDVVLCRAVSGVGENLTRDQCI